MSSKCNIIFLKYADKIDKIKNEAKIATASYNNHNQIIHNKKSP